jgi:ribose 5-phosphate isomerase A
MNTPDISEKSLEKEPKYFYEHITKHYLDKKAQKIGLGSGKTVADFLAEIKGLSTLDSVQFVASSLQIKLQAIQCNLDVGNENNILDIQVLFDGADQVDSEYHMIKGGGGALFREKILFRSAKQVVIMASREKYVDYLHRAIPVEVHPFARALFVREINNLGKRVLSCTLRFLEKGFPFFTENGNVIFDVQFDSIGPIRTMETDIKSIPGVIEVGLFPRPTNACYYKIYPDNSFEIIEFGLHR